MEQAAPSLPAAAADRNRDGDDDGGGETLKSTFRKAEAARDALAHSASPSSSPEYQASLSQAIALYEASQRIAEQVGLFSTNESLEDIPPQNLQYLLTPFHLAGLRDKIATTADLAVRRLNLLRVRSDFDAFLRVLDSHDMLPPADARLYEAFAANPDAFSTAPNPDPVGRREAKIRRSREERDLEQRVKALSQPQARELDDDELRKLWLAQITLSVHKTFHALEMMAQELTILSSPESRYSSPSSSSPSSSATAAAANSSASDHRDRRKAPQSSSNDHDDDRSLRLDNSSSFRASLTAAHPGPLLSASGKPLRPFTLIDKRTQLRQGVFRPDHSLPTMSIDDYLAEERRRGGIIDGGGPDSARVPEPDEDNYRKADEETLKARAWDDFKDENPRGAGNTLNRG